MKICTKCGIEQPLDNFYKRPDRESRRGYCKSCAYQVYGKHQVKVYDKHKKNTLSREENARKVQRWRANNVEALAYQRCVDRHKRRARMHSVPGSFTKVEWIQLCAFYDNRCVCCGKKEKLSADHVIPLTWEGSSNYITNIQPLCTSCNSSKRNYHSTDYRPAAYCNLYL